MTLALALTVAVLYGAGTYLVLQRTLTRIILGLSMIGHGANLLLLLSGGRAGAPPLVPGTSAPTADPLPQALALTAIVISFGVLAFLLALAYRSWTLHHEDLVAHDVEDRRIARLASQRDSEDGTRE